MKANQKRLAKLMSSMSNQERIVAVLDAIAADDQQTVQDIAATTPRKTYTQLDAEVGDAITKAELIGLRFDLVHQDLEHRAKLLRIGAGFFNLLSLESSCPDNSSKHFQKADEFHDSADEFDEQRWQWINGHQQFAKTLGLRLSTLLAFSMTDTHKLEDPVDNGSNDVKEALDYLQAIWSR